MNEEEKEAIDYLQLCYDISTIDNESIPKLGIVLNLIDRLQKENEELKEDNKALINSYFDTSNILNKRINCLFELLQQEGYLKFDNREQAIDYIDKLIKAEEENE